MTWRRESEHRPAPKADVPARGRPLDPTVRGRMETRLGHDFSTVRVHHGPEARALHARAFTVGEDVTFAPGQFAPGTTEGEKLIEHELGHVVEHRRGAEPGIYRAPDDGPLPTGKERPLGLRAPDLGLGSLSLGMGVLDGFAFKGADLTDDHRKQIADIADLLITLTLKQPGGRIQITGHTDLVGGEQVNLDLGRKRAVAVAVALAGAGIPLSMMDITSAGMGAPAVQSEAKEPKNRRVEVRYTPGKPLGAETKGGLTLGGEEQKSPVTVPQPWEWGGPITPRPPIWPGWTPQPSPTTPAPPTSKAPQPPPGSTERGTREATAGDILEAIAAVPEVKKLIDEAQAQVEKDLGRLSTGEKVVVGSVAGSIVAGAVAGVASDPIARKAALDFLDGKQIPVPWTNGTIYIVPKTGGGDVGGVVGVDIIKVLGGGKKKK
jgi:outer membrane protein OmpA-like peptidoglycan-associated protein